jgi:hypothetical protein
MAAIYAIFCSETGKYYVGCTSGPPQKRWREHRCLLRAGKHASCSLQADWFSFGEAQFHFIPNLERILFDAPTVDVRRKVELKWMDYFAAQGKLYNERRISFQPPEGAQALAAAKRVANGYRPSPESNEKRRLAQLGKPKGHGAKIRATKLRNKAMR